MCVCVFVDASTRSGNLMLRIEYLKAAYLQF